MRLATSPAFLESIANHPRVYPSVSLKGCGSIDLAPHWADCIGLEWDEGGFVFHRQGEGVYEVHTLFLPRTPDTSGKARAALQYMFTRGATVVLTQVPRDLPHVRRFAEKHGFTRFDTVENGWQRDSGPVDLDQFALTREEWQGCQSQQ